MEPIGKQFDKLKARKNFREIYEQEKHRIINDTLVKQIMEKFELTDENVGPYLTQLDNVRMSHDNCQNCNGLSECANQLHGHKIFVQKYNGAPVFTNKPCKFLIEETERKKQQKMIKSYYVNEELRNISFKDVREDIKDEEKRRSRILEFLILYAKEVAPGKEGDGIGIYLYGWFGSGKTFMMWALMNYLSQKRGINSIIVYVPDFVRELKSSFNNKEINIEDKINAMKEVPILVLDDIGAESLTPWVRDEVIGPLLDFRVNHKLPTLFTSNKNLKDLHDSLAFTSANGKENQKADRIMERIENYCNVLHTEDRNRRKEKNAHKLVRIE
ncbi:primosomal protein DnaI (plasmid) [Rossellomorea sp. AcN35-11]|nr:primosomal protein DnaI [Rossellomorea aquimaris]WJV32213.1 primosomal protein DnaI [Rossellomorea sp. AcN35-11]